MLVKVLQDKIELPNIFQIPKMHEIHFYKSQTVNLSFLVISYVSFALQDPSQKRI